MQREIIEYRTVCGSFGGIDLLVNAHVKEGWQPLGNLTFYEGKIYQAMVKYKETECNEK
jgi:hypothetical protein